ncbi:hypothetical protein [Tahibacter soli]|uniref:Parallel beta helix pectate lyase-like protein n=1 Tax=Tahibacter soli TaxID=2983605 RepID=A0A9X3YLV5_9GAMM|nr:hypothetical protein [Tahibacter soli]MDC8013580.1 hypothetical protein [Tahibacter soli]
MRHIGFLAIALACGGANAATYVVDSTADTCTLADRCLRRAVALANADAATDTIVFDIPGDPAQPRRIVLGSELKITQPVVIDGYTQPGSSANTLGEGTNAQIRIVIDAGGGDRHALYVTRGPTEIRGVSLVNSATGSGLYIDREAAEVNLRGSFVGVEPDGVTAKPNRWGVTVAGEFNVIGGTTATDRNLVSGNTWSGVLLYGERSIRNAVVGNLIGTDRNAAPVLGNGWDGVQVTNARLSRIGGYSRALQNVIAGNGKGGVYLISNTPPGIEYLEVVSRIYGNGVNYAAVESDCSLTNDPGDADAGANECLNHPTIERATVVNGELVIEGAFDSAPNRPGRVALYGNTRACTSPRGGETGHFLGYADIATDAGGHAPLRFVTSEVAPGYSSVTAIAGVGQEDLFVDATSRVSPCVAVAYADRIFANGFQ